MGLISEILSKVDAVTLNYTAKAFQAIAAQYSMELHLMLVLYIAIYGLAVLQGVIPGTTRELAKHILKAFIVFELATNWGTFTIFFYDVFTSGPDKLIAALVNGTKPSDQLNTVFDQGMMCAANIFVNADTFDFGMELIGLLVAIGTLLMTGFALFLIILAKLGIAVLLSLGPIFIALALWRGTKGLFQSWVNYLVNFALIPVITYGVLSLVIQIMQEAVTKMQLAGETVRMQDVIPYLLVASIAALLFAQVNHIAASLGNGMALSTMNAVSRAMGAVNSGGQAAVKTPIAAYKAGRATYKGGKKGVQLAKKGVGILREKLGSKSSPTQAPRAVLTTPSTNSKKSSSQNSYNSQNSSNRTGSTAPTTRQSAKASTHQPRAALKRPEMQASKQFQHSALKRESASTSHSQSTPSKFKGEKKEWT